MPVVSALLTCVPAWLTCYLVGWLLDWLLLLVLSILLVSTPTCVNRTTSTIPRSCMSSHQAAPHVVSGRAPSRANPGEEGYRVHISPLPVACTASKHMNSAACFMCADNPSTHRRSSMPPRIWLYSMMLPTSIICSAKDGQLHRD